jgi:hypothetical protein
VCSLAAAVKEEWRKSVTGMLAKRKIQIFTSTVRIKIATKAIYCTPYLLLL